MLVYGKTIWSLIGKKRGVLDKIYLPRFFAKNLSLNMPKKLFFIFRIALLLVLICACGEQNEPTSSESTYESTDAMASAIIGYDGGNIRGKAGTRLAGVSLQIPPGALNDPVNFSIYSVARKAETPENMTQVGPEVEITPALPEDVHPLYKFRLTLPYLNVTTSMAVYHIVNGNFQKLPVAEISSENSTITTSTKNTGQFIVLAENPKK